VSFILDALKKSEIERQRQSAPGLMDTRMGRRRGSLPIWAVLLGLLLVINLVVLAVLLRNNGSAARSALPESPVAANAAPAKAAAGAKAAADAANGDTPTAGTEHFSPLDPTPIYAPEIPVATDGPSGNSAVATSPSVAPLRIPPSRVAPLGGSSTPRISHRPDPVLTDETVSAEDDEVLPSINEVNLTGPEALPDLRIDVHVYATKPSDRFVYINMRKYHEGAVLQEGPTLEHIRRDGVVLNFHGVRFVLPRQS
jgi:general secretion pathway protein B